MHVTSERKQNIWYLNSPEILLMIKGAVLAAAAAAVYSTGLKMRNQEKSIYYLRVVNVQCFFCYLKIKPNK